MNIESDLKKAKLYHQSGELKKAQEIYFRILETDRNHSETLYLLGLTFYQTGENAPAAELFNKAILNDPQNPVYYNNLGNALQDLGRLDEAISSYQKAVQFNPDLVAAYYDMGVAFHDQGKLDEAVSCYRKALQLDPGLAGAYNNMGKAFQDRGKLDEAIPCYQKALELKPGHAEACNNMGLAFRDGGRSDEAIVYFERAVELKPDLAEGWSNLVLELEQMCAWQKVEDLAAKLDDLTKEALNAGRKTPENPFVTLTRHDKPSQNLSVARSWSSDIARPMSNLKMHFPFAGRRSHERRITIGYMSYDYRNHPVAQLIVSLFGLHDRNSFRVLCYSYGPDDGSYCRKKIQNDCDEFVDITAMNHIDAAKRIYEDRVDILVDLMGYTKGNRLEICALRPAPVQVSWLGFPGTTGADFLDYIITDKVVSPEAHEQYYSENLVYLPHCYQVNDYMQRISDKGWKRKDFRLPEAGFVFCSFNQGYKIDRVMFDVWMNILQQVPNSVLWLQGGNRSAERNLKREAETRGVTSERLIFAERLPKDEHLGRLALAGLALDTRIYNGHTTTSDSLWTGLPVIALRGTHFASRVSASILTAIGLPELITNSLEEYGELAVRLACNPDELTRIRARLLENRLTHPLFDTPRFARNLENGYKKMWEIFVAGQKPQHIEVVEH